MSAPPFFSVLVPTYNHAKYVGAALDSLLAQTDPDWEAVVVNDGSTDNTADVLNRYAQRDPRIRVIHKPNGGTGSALNRALSESRGDWICWLSSDDYFDPKKLALHRTWIDRDPRSRFHFTYFRLLIEAKGTIVDHQLWGPLPEPEFQVLGLFYRNYVSGISICVHRESWEHVGRFNERLRYAQDYDMWLRLLARYPGTFIPEWTCTNRNHAGQGSEVFPQACYYDCAAACVQFLNEHRFERMFPLLDLHDPACALHAVERALTHASDDSAFLYWYGAHPGLLMRTLEWAWDKTLPNEIFQQREPCRRMVCQILADTARRLRGTSLGWYWQIAAAATQIPGADFTFQPIHPIDVGLALLRDLRAKGKTDVADLQRYFNMQYGKDLPAASSINSSRTVLCCDLQPKSAVTTRALDIAKTLHSAGCKVALVTEGPNRLGLVGMIPVIEVESAQITSSVINALLPTDTIVWCNTPPDLHKFPSRHHHILSSPFGSTSDDVEEILKPSANPIKPRVHRPDPNSHPRRKVVFIGARPWGGGAERVTHELLHALDPEKHELHFVHLLNEGLSEVDFAPHITVHDVNRELKSLNVNSHPLPKRFLSGGSRFLRTLSDFVNRHLPPGVIKQHLIPYLDSIQQIWPHVIALKEIFQRIGSDAILIPVMEAAAVRVWLAQSFARQKYVVSLHTNESSYLPLLYPNSDRLKIESFLFSCACRGASAVTIPSQGCKTDLVQHFDVYANKVEVMPNPVSLKFIRESCGDAPEFSLPAMHGKCLFVHAARLSYAKNHRLLLDACDLLRRRYPNFLVLCLGGGELHGSIQQEIRERKLGDHVILVGEVKNPFAFMARAQGLLLTSHFESFALVLVEAMACGAVPISVDCPYGPREVLDNGRYGLLVPMNDPGAFANAMRGIAEDRELRANLSQMGPARAREYDSADITSQWEKLISGVQPLQTRTKSKPIRHQTGPACTSSSQRRKLVFIGRTSWGGGAERATYDLMHGLDAAKYELHFVQLFNNDHDCIHFDPRIVVHSVEDELNARAIQPYALWRRCFSRFSRYLRKSSDWLRKRLAPVPLRQSLDSCLESTIQMWPHVIALNDIFVRIGSDALLIPVMEEAAVRVWLTQALAKRPYYVFLQIAESYYMRVLYPAPERLMVENFFLSSACRGAEMVAVPSQGCKDDLVCEYDVSPSAIEVAPNPVNIAAILRASQESPEIPLPDLNGRFLFLHVARLDYQKNHRLLLEACQLLKARGKDFLVICLGGGAMRDEIQRQIVELDLGHHVLLLGEVKNPFAYMARAGSLLLTSRFESFALVLVEAMACGAVPISVDCPHGPREVLDQGTYGVLVPMQDPAAFADAMYRVAHDAKVREDYRRVGLERARDYDLPEIARKWEGIIDRLLDPSLIGATVLDPAA